MQRLLQPRVNQFAIAFQSLFPLPGGEGQGEGERHNQFFNP